MSVLPPENITTVFQRVCRLEHKTCDILAAERLRLMGFANRLIIDSFHEAIYVYLNGNL